jgi:Flp pilus assembly pilin Flp
MLQVDRQMTPTEPARRFRLPANLDTVRWRLLLADRSGVATIEYAILAAGIAITLVAALTQLGRGVEGNWNEVDAAVQGPTYNIN